MEDMIVGIDLGTSYSCVAIFRNEKVEIIPDEDGNRIIPSVVSISKSDGEILVGEVAKKRQILNPLNTIYGVKRLMGKKYEDYNVQKEIEKFSFHVDKDEDGFPLISVEVDGESTWYSPDQISSFILKHLKNQAEVYLGVNVSRAVITVPSYFSDASRIATKNAAKIAGLDVKRIINEPTSAAVSVLAVRSTISENKLEFMKKVFSDKNEDVHLLVVDFGGGTFGCSVLRINPNELEFIDVVSTSGDNELGGEDFDRRIVDYFVSSFEESSGIDLYDYDTPEKSRKRAIQKLRRKAENVKILLSTKTKTSVNIPSLFQGRGLKLFFTRKKFEELTTDLMKRMRAPLKDVLKGGGLQSKDIKAVILVGGSTSIPKIKKMMGNYFKNAFIGTDSLVDPMEAVAHGAAITAAIIDKRYKIPYLVNDVTPFTLGVESGTSGKMLKLIEKNTKIPVVTTPKDFRTVSKDQTDVVLKVYRGDEELVKDNEILEVFSFENIVKPLSGGYRNHVCVVLSMDHNGVVNVTVKDSKFMDCTVRPQSSEPEEIEEMLRRRKNFWEKLNLSNNTLITWIVIIVSIILIVCFFECSSGAEDTTFSGDGNDLVIRNWGDIDNEDDDDDDIDFETRGENRNQRRFNQIQVNQEDINDLFNMLRHRRTIEERNNQEQNDSDSEGSDD